MTYTEELIIRLCNQPRTFEFISKNLNGLDPVEIFSTLEVLAKQNSIKKKGDLWTTIDKKKYTTLKLFKEEPELYLKKYMGYFDFLKTPHPLDFEWRNSTESLNYLLTEIQTHNTINDKILFLGMPTLFATACLKDIPQKVTLIERNKPIVQGLSNISSNKDRFRIIEQNIFNVSPSLVGDHFSVIMDPPWYSPHFYQFMWLASQCVKVGGFVGISLPPINTRPTIDSERIDWFSFCQKHGLCIENLYSQKLQYAMPFFEFNAFRAAGVQDIFPFWRKGDFAIFRKVKKVKLPRPKFKEESSAWIEKSWGNCRIRIKCSEEKDNSKLKITHLLKGDILPSVSTRDERRKEANVWTSGNRIFKVSNTHKFVECLDKLAIGEAKTSDEKMVLDFLNTISELEKNEYNNYLDWLYHEMERNIN